MKIAYITAGAAGMFCGSCMHDNTLVAALRRSGHDALLIPTYTPIRTDEEDVSQQPRLLRRHQRLPAAEARASSATRPGSSTACSTSRRLLRWVSRFAVKTQAEELGDLTVSMLEGEHGQQRKEIDKLVALARRRGQAGGRHPHQRAALRAWCRDSKQRLGVPVLGSLQGDDIFLEVAARAVPPAVHRADPRALPRDRRLHRHQPLLRRLHGRLPRHAARADPRRLPRPEPHGPRRAAAGARRRRRSPSATSPASARRRACTSSSRRSVLLRQMPGTPPCRLRVSGWLGENNRPYFDEHAQAAATARAWPTTSSTSSRPTTPSKVRFLQAHRRAVGADDVPRAEGAVRAGGAGQRRAGGAAAARLVPRADRGDRRRPAGRARTTRTTWPMRLRRLLDNRAHRRGTGPQRPGGRPRTLPRRRAWPRRRWRCTGAIWGRSARRESAGAGVGAYRWECPVLVVPRLCQP